MHGDANRLSSYRDGGLVKKKNVRWAHQNELCINNFYRNRKTRTDPTPTSCTPYEDKKYSCPIVIITRK